MKTSAICWHGVESRAILAQVLFNEALLFFWCVLAQKTCLYILSYETILCTMEVISFRALMFQEVFRTVEDQLTSPFYLDSLK